MPKCANCGQEPHQHKVRRGERERLVCADNRDVEWADSKEDRVRDILRQLDGLTAREEKLKKQLAVLTDQPWVRP